MRQYYSATFKGKEIVARSSDPEHAACRALKARGLTGCVAFYRPEAAHPGMIVRDLNMAADLHVVEAESQLPSLRAWRSFDVAKKIFLDAAE